MELINISYFLTKLKKWPSYWFLGDTNPWFVHMLYAEILNIKKTETSQVSVP